MLTYYSFGPGANSLKPMLALYEKELTFEHKLLNPRVFEHHSDWYKAINPRGQVPALDDAGKIITESTVICEYLEDAHPTAVKLRPDDHFDRAQMRIWTKWVDEYFCWCVSTIGWAFPQLVSGSVIISYVLSLPTAGPLLLQALLAQDMYLAGAFILLLCCLSVVGMLVSDILLAIIDPRIRYR